MRYLLLLILFVSGCGLAQDPAMQKQISACIDAGKAPVYTNNGFVVFFACVDEGESVSIE